jgi:zinc D-Ala-D-Ala dipeptidase
MVVKYKNLVNINVVDNGEKLVKFQNNFLLRQTVIKKLNQVELHLQLINPNYTIRVLSGFRNMSKQIKMFKKQLSLISQKRFYQNSIDLYEKVHQYIAVPSVAGHPTGGAIDLLIINKETKKPIEFGSNYLDFDNPNIKYSSPSISNLAKQNRKLLRQIMMQNEFAPYDGEWWHFSYGDKEWAFYYKKESAIYNQLLNVKIQL